MLDTTGSAAAFGGILAVSMVPTILCSPLGGVLADRVPRQRIMWGLDFFTAALVLGYGLFFASRGTVLAVGVLMVLLAAIQALYQPSVQASIPALASEEHLPAANGVVAQVQALANLLGPILGGMLYGLSLIHIWSTSLCPSTSSTARSLPRPPRRPPARSEQIPNAPRLPKRRGAFRYSAI